MIDRILFEIAAILALSGFLAIVARILKQPSVLAYLLAGAFLAPLGYFTLESRETLEVMARLGIALLLFLVGIEMNVSRFKQVGWPALIVGIGQIVFTAAAGFFIVKFLGFNNLTSFYVSAALTFSSTIIVVKLLSEKKDLKSLHGQIAVGVLLVQDFVAIFALVFLAGLTDGGFNTFNLTATIIKSLALFWLIFFLGKKILPHLVRYLAGSGELLFLTSVAWAIGVAYVFSSPPVGLSLEIGGFLAGLALSFSTEHFQIYSRIRPLRDFFIIAFFIVLGGTVTLSGISEIWLPAAVLSVFVLVGNPLIVLILMGILGYTSRTSFLTGLAMAQISEFSFVLAHLGNRLGHIGDDAVSLVTVVGAATIVASAYLIVFGNRIYEFLSPLLAVFEKKGISEAPPALSRRDHIVLVGAHRLGQHLLRVLPKEKTIVVDFDPEVVRRLKTENFHAFYGDIADAGIQEKAGIAEAKMIISTVPDIEDNLVLLKKAKPSPFKGGSPKILATAEAEWEAKVLYDEGADYVILPHLIGGETIAAVLSRDHNLAGLGELRRRDLATLEKLY